MGPSHLRKWVPLFGRRSALIVSLLALMALVFSSLPAQAQQASIAITPVSSKDPSAALGLYWEVSSEFLRPDGSVVFPSPEAACGPLTWTLRRDPNVTASTEIQMKGYDFRPVGMSYVPRGRSLFDVPLTVGVCADPTFRTVAPTPVLYLNYGSPQVDELQVPALSQPVLAVGSPCAPIPTTRIGSPGYIGPKFDDAQIYYLPKLDFSRVDVAQTYRGGEAEGFVDRYYCQKSAPSAKIDAVKRGAGRGYIVFDLNEKVCDEFQVCQVSFLGRTYDFHDKKLRRSLSCAMNPQTEFFTWNDFCLKVPKNPGKYPFDIFMSDGKYVEKGDGWGFVCRQSFSTTRCAWEYDGDEVYNDTDRWKRTVIVTPADVTLKKRY